MTIGRIWNRWITLVVLLSLAGCDSKKELQTGVWRGVFWVDDQEVPINFEIDRHGSDTFFIAQHGAARDTFQLSYIGEDSIHISPQTYEYRLFAQLQPDGSLRGEFRNLALGNSARILPFEAFPGEDYRFVEPEKALQPTQNLSGRWSLSIADRSGPAANRVAVLSQVDNNLEGIILAITGDTGELEGNVSGDEFWLSRFSGIGVTLVRGQIINENEIKGVIGFGERALHFTGIRNDTAALADAYQLTYLKPGFEKLEMSLPRLDGTMLSLDDPAYKGKVIVLDILGSWCPNCMDQIEFLNPWYEKNKHRGVEVIGVAFEVKDDLTFANRVLDRVIKRYNISYPIVFGGKAESENVQSKFPALNTFLAFPTTIIIGRDGSVKSIHTGFSGKGTGKFYEEFVEKWNRDMDEWLAEPVHNAH